MDGRKWKQEEIFIFIQYFRHYSEMNSNENGEALEILGQGSRKMPTSECFWKMSGILNSASLCLCLSLLSSQGIIPRLMFFDKLIML